MNVSSLLRRFLLGAGLALAALAPAALGGPVADAQAAPTLGPLRVQASGTEATVAFTSSEPVAVSVTYKPVAPAAGRPTTEAWYTYATTHEATLTGLASDTTYAVTVTARTQKNRTATAQATFSTLKKRVRVTLDQIVIHSDGDLIGEGEPTWFWTVGRPVITVQDCFPAAAGKCKEGGFGSGTITPTTSGGATFAHVFAEENFQSMGGEDYTTMPTDFVIKARAVESDAGLGWLDDLTNWGAFLEGSSAAGWQAPQGVESASKAVTLEANDGRFRSTMTFRFELFHDSAGFPPNDGRVHSTSK